MEVPQAVTIKLGHTEPKKKKTQPTKHLKQGHAMKSGTILNHNKAMGERMEFSSTNTLKYI